MAFHAAGKGVEEIVPDTDRLQSTSLAGEMGYNFRPPGLLERLLQRRVDTGGSTELSRCLGLFSLIVQGLAHMLGAGIFVITPSIVQSMAGPAACVSYLLSGFAAALSVICYCDLASRYACTGSAYVYTYVSLGELAAAVSGFFLIGELIIQAPMLTLGLSDNIDTFLINGTVSAWEKSHFPDWMLHTDLIAIGIMLIFMIVNIVGIKAVSYLNIAIAAVSVISLLVFNGVALWKGSLKNLHQVVNPADGRTGFAPFGLSGIVTGAGTAFFAFVGLESVVTLAEEAVNPKRDLPRATLGSFLIVLILYVLTAFSIAYFEPWYELGGNTGLIGSLKRKGLVIPQYVVTAGLIFTVFSCGLCTLTTVVRVVYSVAEDGLIFSCLRSVNGKTQVPIWNVIVCSVLGILGSIVYDFNTLSHMISGGTLSVFVVTAIAVMILSYDLSDDVTEGETEETPLTKEPQSNRTKLLFAILLCLFLLPTIALAALVAFSSQTTTVIVIEVVLALLMVVSLILIAVKIPLNAQEEDGTLFFKSPGKPFVQGLSVLVNLILLFHLEVKALKQLAVYCIVGLIVYFGYGIFFSRITVEKQKQQEKESISLKGESSESFEGY